MPPLWFSMAYRKKESSFKAFHMAQAGLLPHANCLPANALSDLTSQNLKHKLKSTLTYLIFPVNSSLTED